MTPLLASCKQHCTRAMWLILPTTVQVLKINRIPALQSTQATWVEVDARRHAKTYEIDKTKADILHSELLAQMQVQEDRARHMEAKGLAFLQAQGLIAAALAVLWTQPDVNQVAQALSFMALVYLTFGIWSSLRLGRPQQRFYPRPANIDEGLPKLLGTQRAIIEANEKPVSRLGNLTFATYSDTRRATLLLLLSLLFQGLS